MKDEVKKRIDEILEEVRKELEEVAKRVEEYVSEGEAVRAYRVWREGLSRSLRGLQSALRGLVEGLRGAELTKEELEGVARRLTEGVEEVLRRADEIGRSIEGRGRRGRLIKPLADTVEGVFTGVAVTVDKIVDGVSELVERVERSVSEVGRRLTQVVSARLRERDLEVIDALVDAGLFRSRSEAVAYFVRKGIEASKELVERALEQSKKVRELRESLRRELGLEDEE